MRLMICVGLMLLMTECSNEEFRPSDEAQCRISRYVYEQEDGSDKSYNISYTENSFTQVSLVTRESLTGSNWVVDETYKFIYQNDSLYVKDFRQFTERETYVTALVGERIQTIVTSFPETNGTYRYTFDYSKGEEVTVTLDKLDGHLATFDSRGVYKFTDHDVDTVVITRNPDIHGNDADPFTSRTKTYTYDVVRNPLKELVLPHFIKPELPDVTYFSARNRITEKYDNVIRNFTFEYGTDPMPTRMTKPDGVVEKYEYSNCTN